MFENKYIEEWDCHYSRVIESWHNVCRKFGISYSTTGEFREWLKDLNYRDYRLTLEQINDLMEMFECGKLELEMLAKKHISTLIEYSK